MFGKLSFSPETFSKTKWKIFQSYLITRGLEALTRMLFLSLSLVSEWRLRPVNKIKRKWWMIFFLLKGMKAARLLWLFFDWVELNREYFHLWTALQKMSNISLEGFYWYKNNLSGRRLFGENFQVPRSLSLVRLRQKRKINLRSHDLTIDRWIDKDRNKREGNFSHTVKPANSWDEHFENFVSIQYLYWIKNLFIQ